MISGNYVNLCLDTLTDCKRLLCHLKGKLTDTSSNARKVIEESAHICMGTFYAIKNNSVNAARMALLCMGICEECAEVCENIDDVAFKQGAQACRNCSTIMQPLAREAIND